MMPFTAGILEPLAESIPLGLYAAWSAHYFFGLNPYAWFFCHWAIWCLLDYSQVKGVQVSYHGNSTPTSCEEAKKSNFYVIFHFIHF